MYRLTKVLQNGADVHYRSNGWTVLLWICWKNQNISLIQLIRLLIDYGANANDADFNKNSVLHILVRFNQTPTLMFSIKELLKGGVDVNQVDSRRWTVLHHLARFNQSKELLTIMELLLDNGADIQAKDLEGWNVLFYLARFYQSIDLIDFFHLMIQRGIDLSVRDLEGWNVLHVVCRFYCQPGKLLPIFKLLVENGVDLHLRTYTKLHALELLLFNSGGDFHSTCMWVIKHRRADWERLIWNEESLLNMAKLGCQKWTFYFSKDVAFHCMDGHGNSVLSYLQEVGSESTSLCPRCKPMWQFNKLFMYKLAGVNDKKPVRQLSFQSFIPSFHETFIPLRSCIVSSEHDLKPVPKPARWRRMVQAWQDSRLGVDEVEFYLSENSHWNCHLNCQWCSIFDHVKSYLNSLIKKIHTFDDRFESDSLLEYGSWAERSDILPAKEFDFGILLKHFKALPSTTSSMASTVVFAKPDSQVDSFYVPNCGICSGRMLYYYKALVEEATRRIWNVHFFQPLVSMSETCVTITFTYRGKKQKPTKISVDLSLVVTVPAENGTSRRFGNSQTSQHLPEVLFRLNVLRQNEWQKNFVANRRKEKGLWKVSYFEMERDIFLHPSCFPDVSHILRLLKFFVLMANHRTNPHREGEQHIIQRKTNPSSYALKTCLFYYMNQTCRPPWNSEDRLLHCIGVLKVYVSSGHQLKSFFFDDVVACTISIDSRRIVTDIITKLERMKNLRISYGILFDEVIQL